MVQFLQLSVDKGEADLKQVSVLEESSIVVEDGAASVYGDLGFYVNAVCKQGKLNLAVSFAESDCNYTMDVSGGNLSIGNHNYHGRSETQTVDNHGDYTLDLTCKHGDLSVEFMK